MRDLKTALLLKWLGRRQGRMAMLAQLMGYEKNTLYQIIYKDRMTKELYQIVTHKQVEIEKLETECVQEHRYFKRFIRRGDGRLVALSEVTHIPVHVLRSMANAKGEQRFIMCKYGISRIMNGIKEVDTQRRKHSIQAIELKAEIRKDVKKRIYSMSQIEALAMDLKVHANFGNQSSAILFHRLPGDQLRVVSVGFDTFIVDPMKAHVCDNDNPHIHAPISALLDYRRDPTNVHALEIYSLYAPCHNCANWLHRNGVSAVYSKFNADDMLGVQQLIKSEIQVYKQHGKKYRKLTLEGV